MGCARVSGAAELGVWAGARGGVGRGRIDRVRRARGERRSQGVARDELGFRRNRIVQDVKSADESAWAKRSNKARRDFLNDILAHDTK